MAAASITGVFTILDRASGPMRKMEAQAAKTMAAIEGVGAALDSAGGRGTGGNDFSRNAEKMTRGLRDMERGGGQAAKALDNLGDSMKKADKDGHGFVGAMQKIRDVAGGLAGILGGLKFGGLVAGLGTAVQAVGALSAGVISLIPRLTDLVGVLAAAPAAVGAFAQSMGTLMIAMKPAFAAISAGFQKAAKATDPYQAALNKLAPAGQKFVKQVVAMRPAFMQLQQAAGTKLFPALSASLKDLTKLFPTLRSNLTATGGALGKSISGLTGDLTTPQRVGDINKIMQSQTRIVGYAGQGFRNLANALVDFMVAARPFSEWLGRTVSGWTKYIANATKAGRETGGIARYLEGTRSALELFGGMLKDVWQIFMALMKASRPLGERLWGGAARATEGWAKFLQSAEGAKEARKWFDSMYEPLHAMGQLAKTVAVELFGMTKNTSGVTATAEALQKAVPALADLLTGASQLTPSLASALTEIAKLLSSLPFSPLKVVLDAFTGLLKVVNALITAIPGLGMAISVALTAAAGSKMFTAILSVRQLAAAWASVGTNARTAGTLTRESLPGTGGGMMGKMKGRAGMAGAVALGGSALAMAGGAAAGGKTGEKISSVGGMAATGAGVGLMFGPWGALAGGLIGATAGAISVGLFKGADRAKEAGKRAGKNFMDGLGMAGIDPKTGLAYKPGQNPYASLGSQVQAAQTRILKARQNLLSGGVDLAAEGGRSGAGAVGNGLRPKVLALDRAESAAVPTLVRGITQPRQGRFLSNAPGVVGAFAQQFGNLGPMAQREGAQALVAWARGMENKKQAVKGYTRGIVNLLTQEFGSIRSKFGSNGKQAMERFAAEAKRGKAVDRVKELANTLSKQLDLTGGGVTSRNWEGSIGRRIQRLREAAAKAPKGQRSQYNDQIKELERLVEKARRAQRALDDVTNPRRRRGSGPAALNRTFNGQRSARDGNVFGVPKEVQPPSVGRLRKAMTDVDKSTDIARRSFKSLGDQSQTTRTRLTANSISMAKVLATQSSNMVGSANRILGSIKATQIKVASTGARFASGGRIPGQAKGDHIPLYGRGGGLLGIADGGELVVNRHTEKRVNGMLASHGTSLGREVAGETLPHYARGGRVRVPTISGGGGEMAIQRQRMQANALLGKEGSGLNQYIEKQRSKMAAAMAGGGGSAKGLVAQVLRAIAFARAHGWSGSITSGFRTRAEQAVLYQRYLNGTGNRAAPPGQSNHEGGQAIDVTDTEGFARAMAMAPANAKLLRLVPGEPWHFSVTGHAKGGRLPRFGGWHAQGMHGMVNRPTLIGVGERGPEKVKVTPVGKSGAGGGRNGIQVHIGSVHYNAKGDIAKAIKEEMELLSDELSMMGEGD